MEKEMNQTEFVNFSSELLNKIEDSIRLMHSANQNPSIKGAIIVMVEDDTDSNTIHYISERTELYDSLSDNQKEKISNVSEEQILVIIGWKGLFAYYEMDIETTIDYSKEKIEDTEENEERILTLFYNEYMESRKIMTDLSTVAENASYLDVCFDALIDNILNGNETPEFLMTFVYFFTYNELRKIDFNTGKGVVKPENMLRNFNEFEQFNFSFIGGTILTEIYDAIDASNLKENEKIDFRLDIDNFVTVANNSEGLEFDKNTKSFDHLAGMANEIRKNAN